MKYLYLVFLTVFYPVIAGAQQYRCLQAGTKHYFTNDIHYLRGIRIDSVRSSPDATIYYPFHTKRGRYLMGSGPAALDANGGSWLGKKVVELGDGTFLFDNIWGDTVTVRTQASVGDSWMFYEDASDVYYMAKVISMSEAVIYGAPDSIKTIRITAHRHSTSGITTDPVNELILSLSKNHGFYQVFDLYLFPHRNVTAYANYTAARDTFDYFFEKCESQQFRHVEMYQPNREEIYDFHVGEIFEYKHYCTYGSSRAHVYDMCWILFLQEKKRVQRLSTPYMKAK